MATIVFRVVFGQWPHEVGVPLAIMLLSLCFDVVFVLLSLKGE